MLRKIILSFIFIASVGVFALYKHSTIHINDFQNLKNNSEAVFNEFFIQKNNLIESEILHFQVSTLVYLVFLGIIFSIVYKLEIQKSKLFTANKILNEVQEITKTGSWEYDLVDKHLVLSDEVYRILGEEPQSFKIDYKTFFSFVHPEDRKTIATIHDNSLKTKTNFTLRHRLIRRNGDTVWVNEVGKNEFNSYGEPIRTLGTIQDISETILYEERIEKIKNKLENVINIQENIVIITNAETLEFANKKLFDFFGYENLEHFLKYHKCICDFFIEDDRFFHMKKIQPHDKHWIESILHLNPRERIVSMVNKSDIPHAFIVAINTYEEDEYIINFSDISDTIIENQTLHEQVIHDPLTNAYNRFYFTNKIKQLIESNQQKNLYTALIMFDIDHFKVVNDTFGHDVGDSVLTTLVNIVHRFSRYDDKLIRWGGEEFIIVISAENIQNVKRQAEHLRTVIENHHFEEVEHVTCSFGCAMYEDSESIEDTIKRVDENLYKAKNSGRNKVII